MDMEKRTETVETVTPLEAELEEATETADSAEVDVDKAIDNLCKRLDAESKKYATWYLVRAAEAGVFFGHIAERNGSEVTMTNVRRIWYWAGAASLSEMAVSGVKLPGNCKFTVRVRSMLILDVIEVIPCTDEAAQNINEVPEWTA